MTVVKLLGSQSELGNHGKAREKSRELIHCVFKATDWLIKSMP